MGYIYLSCPRTGSLLSWKKRFTDLLVKFLKLCHFDSFINLFEPNFASLSVFSKVFFFQAEDFLRHPAPL